MTTLGKRVLGLLLVLSTTVWAQAVCPMMLFPETAAQCADNKAASPQPDHREAKHDCCPRTKKPETKEQAQVSACSSGMSCCAVQRSPATAPKAEKSRPDIAVLGRVFSAELQVLSPAVLADLSEAGPPLKDVFTLKDDLRV